MRWMREDPADDIPSKLKQVEGLARQAGIEVHAQSRLRHFRALYEEWGTEERTGSPEEGGLLLEGFRDFREISFICEILSSRYPEILRRNLKELLSGSLLPSDDANQSARALQFELYLGAAFVCSGFDVRFEEPDILIEHAGEWFGVAAKRVQGPVGLRKRIKEGVRQVRKASKRGLVAMSFDRTLTHRNAVLVTEEGEAFWESAERLLTELMLDSRSAILSQANRPEIVGFVATLNLPAIIRQRPFLVGAPKTGQLGLSSTILVSPVTAEIDDERFSLAIQIGNRLQGPGRSVTGPSALLGQ